MSGKTIKRILACTPAIMLLAAASCTYNYFEGTINYRVFVPEVRDHIVNNCHVLIYDRATGALTAQGYTQGGQSTTDQSKIAEGIFEFRLDKGDYKVCVLANTDSVDFNPDPIHEQASFQLMSHPQPPFTKGPGDLRLDYIDRPHDGATEITDTAEIIRYPARIDVRYRATDVDADMVGKAIVRINNVASVQHLDTPFTSSTRPQNILRMPTEPYSSSPPISFPPRRNRCLTSCFTFPTRTAIRWLTTPTA